ncbi:cytochrome P450 [Aspergillus clavatus NRRL 1]|uniref:Tryprostatin B 6-hydroxylase n=1 Tax=Aspergillus clavatus (strain ATCC 1007 / CBS 513.65 / DSM 816 / NCTC 3887 / NRRL 1 / QM 1276 / 107) TaxID=344612 RepID=A1CMU6_ASPCL|nr:benzoate 4-monooxygenase cytochrome P450 [Aspergillus clavatus NRRL 1]EAW08883.1 benzoate 4-monooxygenase cytochrome P450 [Aspergillus clavatus NRRL 1]
MFVHTLLANLSVGDVAVRVSFLLSALSIAWVVYQRFISQLCFIPGPFLASITPWVQLYHGLKGDRHLWLHRLHQKYGTHVRVAPNFVSVNTARGLHDIYGHGKRLRKANFYNAFPAIKGVYNTHNAIDKTMHGRKRRVLSQAFSDHALKSMEDVMLLHVRQLCAALAGGSAAGQKAVFNLGDYFSYLTYDVMGELCFGKSFDMLVSSGKRKLIELVDRAANRHYVCGLWMPLDTWHLDQIFIHKLTNDRWNFIMNSRVEANARAKERAQAGREAKKDFFYYLLNAKDPETGKGLTTPELWGEANVLMIAGSDTTSTTLSATLFYLVRDPRALALLQKEVRDAFTSVEEIITGPQLNELVYLKACLDEAMRLAPAVPGAPPREILEGGASVDGVFLPAGTDCGTPTYSVHRQAEYYPEPETYIPERWIEGATCKTATESWQVSKEAVEVARRAFCPFSIGPRGCIGKSMAFMEMRLTIARLMFLFDFELADRRGEDEKGQLALVDHFTSAKYGPNVVVRKREM